MDFELWRIIAGMSNREAKRYFHIKENTYYDIVKGKKPPYVVAKKIVDMTQQSVSWEDLGFKYEELERDDRRSWKRYEEKRETLKKMILG